MLNVNNIEVIYDDVILVLKGLSLQVKEGEKVIAEAKAKFPLLHAECVHRAGLLEIGECAVWVGVTSAHRDE
ncbi:MAG: molybdenum cofactor biosynthesis protein MoaE, partial [Deltaproteobacteria bacterium]|nr:molybdenum cofactor biosynthesis protein MoaE [Deltaproteobacteria bacterium]